MKVQLPHGLLSVSRFKAWESQAIRGLGELENISSNQDAMMDSARRDVGKPGNPPALGAGDRRFESGRPDSLN